MAGGVLDELIVVVKTLFDDKGAKKGEKFNKDWKKVIAQITKEYVKLMQRIEQALNSMARFNQAFIDFTRQTSVAMETLNKYTSVGQATNYNFNASTAIQTIEQLQQKLVDLQITGSGARPFQLLGINPIGKDATQLIEEVREKIKDLNNEQATYMLNQLGISAEMLPMLRMSKQEFEEISDIWGRFQFNEEQRKLIFEYGIQLKKINTQFKFLLDGIALKLTPFLLKNKSALVYITKLAYNIYNIVEKIVSSTLKFAPIKLVVDLLAQVFKDIKFVIDEVEDFFMWLTGTGKTFMGENFGEFADIMQDLLNKSPKWVQDLVKAVNKLEEYQNSPEYGKNLVRAVSPVSQIIDMADKTNKSLTGDVIQTNNIYVTNDETGQKIGSKVKDMSYMALRYQHGTVR